jgi:hypothetical protein
MDVIPMQELGVMDVEGGDVSSESLVEKAFQNIAEDYQDPVMEEKGYVVWRGGECVNEYARHDEQGCFTDGADDYPNHLLGAYPYLFPYGEGGLRLKDLVLCRMWSMLDGHGNMRTGGSHIIRRSFFKYLV